MSLAFLGGKRTGGERTGGEAGGTESFGPCELGVGSVRLRLVRLRRVDRESLTRQLISSTDIVGDSFIVDYNESNQRPESEEEWSGAGSNRRHRPFQGRALPTELPDRQRAENDSRLGFAASYFKTDETA